MTSSESRIGVLAGTFLLCVVIVAVHLFLVMVSDHEVWAARSHQNRWAFRSVPALRGAVLDRNGSVLAYDAPTMEVTIYYKRFRMYHPVGAAVHGATVWAQLQPGRELANYSYDGVLGPLAAARDLLAMPVSVFRRGAFDKTRTDLLETAVTTLIANTTGMARRKVYRALRQAAAEPVARRCGEAVPGVHEDEVLLAYDRILDSLRGFDRELLTAPEMQATSRRPGLIARLDWLRRASLEERTITFADADGVEQRGELYESMEWPIADYVPFDLAAPFRVGADVHPGLRVQPGVRRMTAVMPGTSLQSLLGEVKDVGRHEYEGWFDDYFARLPEDWLEDIVPEEAAVSVEDRARMQQQAEQSLKRLVRRYERRGLTGIERDFDDELTGQLGMRLVERDSQQREQLMWSSLRVLSGDDVALTLDSGLQAVAERAATTARELMAALHPDEVDRERCRAAVAVIDASSGDVLAYAGNPVADSRVAGPSGVPGVSWATDGSLGSVVKPFVMIEQLLAEALGRPCTPLAAIGPCSTEPIVYRGTKLRCIGHWEEGRDPVAALAKSCNAFFYQAADGLGVEGVERALQRFGLAEAAAGSEFALCWQPRVLGFHWSAPEVDPALLPRRAIGYGVEASPLAVARAYAALATGRLPKLRMRLQDDPTGVALVGIDRELGLVRQGLAACVQTGTARDVPGLARFMVLGKTGTAEIGPQQQNNAWFAGFLPAPAAAGAQLSFCAAIYWVPDGQHGAEAAGSAIAELLEGVAADPELSARYLPLGGGR